MIKWQLVGQGTGKVIGLIAIAYSLLSCGLDQPSSRLDRDCGTRLTHLERQLHTVETAMLNSPPSIDSMLAPLNNWLIEWDNKFQQMVMVQELGSDPELRSAAQACVKELRQLHVQLFGNDSLYGAMGKLDLSEEEVSTQHFANKLRQMFRYQGVGLSDSEKTAIAERQQTIQKLLETTWRGSPEALRKQYHELARLLGTDIFSYRLSQQMMISTPNLLAYLQELENDNSATDFGDAPQAPELTLSDQTSSDQILSGLTLSDLRFDWPDIREGLKHIAEKLFGLELIAADISIDYLVAQTLTPESFQIFKDGQLVGELVVAIQRHNVNQDHLNFFPLQRGIKAKQTPLFLITGKLATDKESTLSHGQLIAVLHQFGHFLHHQLAREQVWFSNAGISTEADFIEVPAMLLEQWAWSAEGLKIFRREALAEEEQETLALTQDWQDHRRRQQYLNLAQQSFAYFSSSIANQNNTPVLSATEFSATDHCLSDPLLIYQCLLAREIAEDLFTPFQQFGLLDRSSGDKLSTKLLAPGGSRPAVDMIVDFLDRPYLLH